MNFKKIMLFFYIGLPVCTALRVLQIIKTVEYENGFFVSEQRVFGIALTVVTSLVCAVVAFCGNKAYKCPEKLPKNNALLSVFSLLTAISLFAEAFYQAFPITVAPWQMGVIRLVTVAAAFFFAALSLNGFFGLRISPMVHIIPIIYVVIKTIFTFISVSSLALISDNILLMAGYCLLMLFFINYGKLYNSVADGRNFCKISSTGLMASLVCVSQSAAYFIVNIISAQKYLHSDTNINFTLFFMGVFVLLFVLSYFRETEN